MFSYRELRLGMLLQVTFPQTLALCTQSFTNCFLFSHDHPQKIKSHGYQKTSTCWVNVQLPNSVNDAGITEAIQEAIDGLKPEDGPNDFLEFFYKS